VGRDSRSRLRAIEPNGSYPLRDRRLNVAKDLGLRGGSGCPDAQRVITPFHDME
jgi:hypothetical protein